VAGSASFAAGSKVKVQLTNVVGSLGKFTVVKAGSLTGTSGLTANSVLLPAFLKSSLTSNEQAGELAVTIGRKTAAEIGLNRSEAAAWDSVFAVLDKDSKVAGSFLQMTDTSAFRDSLQQMLPEHAGGVFETVTQGSRATARFLRDPEAPLVDLGSWGFWLQQVAWGTSKNLGDTSAYDISGWGAAGGAEIHAGGLGKLGLSISYLGGRDENGRNDNSVRTDQYELAGYWRGDWGPLNAHARASAAHVGFNGSRTFTGAIGNEAVTRTSKGEWSGKVFSAAAGVSYELTSGRISLRPLLAVDYYRLSENGYTETGGGKALDLTVDDRTSDEFAGEASLSLGYAFNQRTEASPSWFKVELEAGRRQILGGAIGATTAQFAGGTPFTLEPESRSDGWTGKLRVAGGSSDFTLGGELGAEQQQGQGRAAIAGRLTLQMGF
jgi:outer membrane autotransporter protein